MIEAWKEAWPKALQVWSPFVTLRDPKLCQTRVEAAKENLTTSFAMIRFEDQQVVVDLEGVAQYKLQNSALEVLAHEIGHHVFCPANFTDHARALVRIRKGLPTEEKHAPLIANLYYDLIVNDHLQRICGLKMDVIYRAIKSKKQPALWNCYFRIYEILWGLPRETLTDPIAVLEADPETEEIEADAILGARMIRAHAKDFLQGARDFAELMLPYLLETEAHELSGFSRFQDMENAADSEEAPSGLADKEDEEEENSKSEATGTVIKNKDKKPRDIIEYGEILKMAGSKLTQRQITAAYYRDLSNRHLIPFPEKLSPKSKEPQAEGLEVWDIGSEMDQIDWFQSVANSRVLIPGITIVERHFSEVPGTELNKRPLDLYIGIDCSGSMQNPAHSLSYPVLAGAIMARSALRAGAKVMACLSGETKGMTIATDGFVRQEDKILELITDYLGRGYAFGIHWLAEHIIQRKNLFPTHLLIVSDSDIFAILQEKHPQYGEGWKVSENAIKIAGGGGTMILRIDRALYEGPISQLEKMGWSVYTMQSMEEIVNLARNFSKRLYSKLEKPL